MNFFCHVNGDNESGNLELATAASSSSSPPPHPWVLVLFRVNVEQRGLHPFTLPHPAPDRTMALTTITHNLTFLPPLSLSFLLSIRLSMYLYVKNFVIYLLERGRILQTLRARRSHLVSSQTGNPVRSGLGLARGLAARSREPRP